MGVYLSQPQTSKKNQLGSNKSYSFCSGQMQGWRKNMEDAVIHQIDLGDKNALFGVFDGHGGFEVSQYVKKVFPSLLKNEPSYQKGDYVKALDQAFRKMDEKIDSPQGAKQLKLIRNKGLTNNNESYGDDTICSGTGCTANVVLITQKIIYVANAGDSRSVLCNNGNAVPLSIDHKPQSPQQQKRITHAGGTITMGRVNGGLNLSRSFGDFDYKRKKQLPYNQQMITCKPDIKQYVRKPNDEFIIVGCDGIWQRYVENSQGLVDIIRADFKANKKLDKIVNDTLNLLLAKDTKDGIGCDNMSMILIKFN